MSLWNMSTVMKDGPVSSQTIQMTSYKDNGTTHKLSKAGEEQTSTNK